MGNSEDKLISSILSEKRKRFPDFEVKEGLLCEKCKEKEVPDNFQLSGMKICRKCYNQEEEEELNRVNELIKNSRVIFDGSEIIPNKFAFQKGCHWEYNTNRENVNVHIDIVYNIK